MSGETPVTVTVTARGRGRPRKYPEKEKKAEEENPEREKRGRGRPKKYPAKETEEGHDPEKARGRGRGRPKKYTEKENYPEHEGIERVRGRGRPRKNPIGNCTVRTSTRIAQSPSESEEQSPAQSSDRAVEDHTPLILTSTPPDSQKERWHLRSMWELASVLNFLHVFRPILNMNMEFSAEELETALITPNNTLSQLHIHLLKKLPEAVSLKALNSASWASNRSEMTNQFHGVSLPKVSDVNFWKISCNLALYLIIELLPYALWYCSGFISSLGSAVPVLLLLSTVAITTSRTYNNDCIAGES
eukprot:Gb_13313 [translate_table: standard]